MAGPAARPRDRRRIHGGGLTPAALGLGANLGDRAGSIASAIAALDARADSRVVARATPRETAPVGGPDGQPPYLNTAVTLETALDPTALWAACRALEQAAGRRRVVPWEPRALDVDLLLHGPAQLDTFALRLPHPRLRGRPFVLEPLAEIAPDWAVPGTTATVAQLRDACAARAAASRSAPATLDGAAAVRAWRASAAGTVGLVPTMGALHAGHRALIDVARTECDAVIVSVYVNPTQFGAGEDYADYPRDLTADLALCAEAGVDAVATFPDQAMYPADHVTRVTVEGPAVPLEGERRPGHFAGVATVVAKLFNLVQPHRSYFGQKDAQQAAVIRRLARDLDWPVDIEVLPTVRDRDGLALSSRNAFLSTDARTQALALWRALRTLAEAVADGDRDAPALQANLHRTLAAAPGLDLEYAAIVEPETFAPCARIGDAAIGVVAARCGATRLIDNVVCWPPPERA